MISFFLLTTTSLFLIISIVYWTVKNGISPMPSSSKARHAITTLLPEVTGPVYELGSGWGHLLWRLSKHYTDVPIIGIENSQVPYLFSKFLFFLFPVKNLSIVRKDFLKTSLEDASLIVCYLYPGAMKKLQEKFTKELRPGTVVISNTFALTKWKPERELVLPDLYHTKIYLYRVPD